MKTIIALLFSILALCFTVRADTLDISGTTHLVAPGLDQNFSTSFLFNTDSLAVSNMSVSDSGTYTGFFFFGEHTFGTPGQSGLMFSGYDFAWDDPNGNQIDIGIPFTLNPAPGDIDFTSSFCRSNCIPGILVPADSPGNTGTVHVSEALPPSDTPESSTLAMLLMGIPVLWVASRRITAKQSLR